MMITDMSARLSQIAAPPPPAPSLRYWRGELHGASNDEPPEANRQGSNAIIRDIDRVTHLVPLAPGGKDDRRMPRSEGPGQVVGRGGAH
jgi:hypothetical protein